MNVNIWVSRYFTFLKPSRKFVKPHSLHERPLIQFAEIIKAIVSSPMAHRRL